MAEPLDGGTTWPGNDGGTPEISYEVTNWDDYSALATDRGELKFLLPVDEEQRCWFQDTDRYPYHLQFLRSLEPYSELSSEGYEDMVLTRSGRRFYAGVLRLFPGAVHPLTKRSGVLAFTIYTEPTTTELLTVQETRHSAERLATCLGSLAPFLVYLPEGNLALAWARQNSAELNEAGVAWLEPSQLRPALQAEVYSAGVAYGYVRRVDAASSVDVGPRDVVVTSTAPGDLGIVAALLTEAVQSSVSHLNLRLREKRIPNAATPQLFESGLLESLDDTLVRVETSDEGVFVAPARLEDAEDFWRKQVPALPDPRFSLDEEAFESLEEIRHGGAISYGVKAANLGELNRALPTDHAPAGIAVPFSAYRHHLEHNGLSSLVEETIRRASLSSPAQASEILDVLRKAIKQSDIDPTWEAQLIAALVEELGEESLTTRLRFRSSTNVEDLPGLSGAGLYDSASGCIADDLDDDVSGPSKCLTEEQATHYRAELERLTAKRAAHPEMSELDALIEDLQEELSEEKSARKALRKVWASLWTDRAFQDRQYYSIDHDRVFMGVAIHRSLVGERLESVLVSNLEPDSPEPLYRLESQAGEVGVVEPNEPDAVSERLQFRRSADAQAVSISLVRASSFASEGTSLWEPEQLEQLVNLAFQVQDHFEKDVYPEQRPLQLDMEIDVTAEGVIWFKQARPYVSGGW